VVPRAVDLVSQLLAAPSTGEEENHQREPYHTVTKATFSPVELTVSALSGRGVSQGRLAHASRRHDQLGGRRRRAGAFAHLQQPYASPLPLVLVGLLAAVFLCIEARRYRFFDFWRIRAHILEVNFFGPILRGQGPRVDNGWNEILYHDYQAPNLHITFFEAAGRRLRRNYGWIFLIQVTCYAGKLLIHPVPIASLGDVWQRAAIGPVPGQLVLLAGVIFHATWVTVAFLTYRSRRGADRERPPRPARDSLLELARGS
jgi:hypothetical protein